MLPKCFLFLFLLLVTELKVKSQTLLNADLSRIKEEVEIQDGGLQKSFIEENIEMKGAYKKFVFRYSLPPEGNDCLMKTTFCLTLKNKCFKYYEEYWGEKRADQKIEVLKIYYPRLQQVKKELKWIDNDNGFEISLIPKKLDNNSFPSVYVLEIKNIDVKKY
jgi:hypothetical protein